MRMFEYLYFGEVGFVEPVDTQAKEGGTHSHYKQDAHEGCNNEPIHIKRHPGF